jgi:hypothetical protein
MAAKQSRFDMMIALKANARDFQRGTAKAQRNLKGFVSQAAPAFGPLNSAAGRFLGTFGMGVSTVKSMIPAIKGVKAALAASGIGAVLIAISTALAGVSAYLTKTVDGADKLNVAWTRTKAVGSVFFDRMIDGGKGLLKIITGNKEGIEDIKNSFKGVFKEANKEQKEAAQIATEENQLKKDKIAFIVEEARLQMEIADLVRNSKNLEFDRGKRMQFLNQSIQKQNLLSDKRSQIAKTELDLQQRRMAMGHNTYEDLQREAELQREILMTEKERDDKNRELENRIREANNALNEQEKLQKKIQKHITDSVRVTKEQNNLLEDTAIKMDDISVSVETMGIDKLSQELQVGTYLVGKLQEGMTAMAAEGNLVGKMLHSSLIQNMSELNDVMLSGSESMQTFAKNMINAVRSTISAMLAQAVAAMVTGALKDWATKVPFGYIVAPAMAALAGGLARSAFNSLVPQLAGGGLAYGDTIARVGEYRGAASNPEVIAPLNRLQGMLGGGKISGRLETDGTTLVALIEKVKRRDYKMR